MHSICFLVLNLLLVGAQNYTGNCDESLFVNNISSSLVNLLGVDEDSNRIKELKEKLKKIDKYVIDKNKYAELLLDETMRTELNETNFHNALNEIDHFRFLIEKEPKNLYLKLKEKMTRDDILKILAERNKSRKFSKSARKMMNNVLADNINDEIIDNVVDKIIAQSPKDNHKFKYDIEDDKYWDPQQELEDLKEFHQHDGRRIFKGERTTIRYYPFMVSIHVMGRFWCGGVIYWHDLVLTSAACLQLMHNNRFFRENPSVLRVRVGSNHSRIGGEMVDALEVYFHPGYNPRTLRHNIAVIRLRRHLFFSYHRIPKMISISHNKLGLSPTSEVLLLGWGVTKHDAGGPALLSGQLVGIISFGPAFCGAQNVPTVFTLVGAHADWIDNVNESMPSYYHGKKRTTTLEPFTYFPEFKPNRPIITRARTEVAGTTKSSTSAAARIKQMIAEDSDMEGFSIDSK
ncbi:unnamed protein product, partial [Brenthis ino]